MRQGDCGQWRLQWCGHLELRTLLPGFVAPRLLSETTRQQFHGLPAEIERGAVADKGRA